MRCASPTSRDDIGDDIGTEKEFPKRTELKADKQVVGRKLGSRGRGPNRPIERACEE